jgi:hypothetical protein
MAVKHLILITISAIVMLVVLQFLKRRLLRNEKPVEPYEDTAESPSSFLGQRSEAGFTSMGRPALIGSKPSMRSATIRYSQILAHKSESTNNRDSLRSWQTPASLSGHGHLTLIKSNRPYFPVSNLSICFLNSGRDFSRMFHTSL